MEKILVSGTGRCGTTFLIKLFTFLNMDTGFTKENCKEFIEDKTLGGLESYVNSKHTVIKNPQYIVDLPEWIDQIRIKCMIIPIRNYKDSAKSRVRTAPHNKKGGLWYANDLESQVTFYHKQMSEYLLYMVQHDIPTIFLDFKKMVSDPMYLYQKLKSILKNTSFDVFFKAYHEIQV
jgi:hypothetical protein